MTSTTADTVPTGKATRTDSGTGNNRNPNQTFSYKLGRGKQWKCALFPRQGKRHRRHSGVRSGGGERGRSAGRGAAPGGDLLRGSGVSCSAGFCREGSRNWAKKRSTASRAQEFS